MFRSLLCITIAFFTISLTSYGASVSIGTSLGAGIPFLYGETFNAYKEYYEYSHYEDIKLGGYTLIMPQIDLMIEFGRFFAIEMGLGYKLSTYQIQYEVYDVGDDYSGSYAYDYILSFIKNYIYIPLMFRGQYEYLLGISYLSVGCKLGFAVGTTYRTTFAHYTEGDFDGYFYYSGDVRPADVLFDVSFSIGHEVKVFNSNYIGIRINYDLGIIKPFYAIEGSKVEYYGNGYPFAEDAVWHQDDLTFSLTYRYAF